jgi:hypothetical protein
MRLAFFFLVLGLRLVAGFLAGFFAGAFAGTFAEAFAALVGGFLFAGFFFSPAGASSTSIASSSLGIAIYQTVSSFGSSTFR